MGGLPSDAYTCGRDVTPVRLPHFISGLPYACGTTFDEGRTNDVHCVSSIVYLFPGCPGTLDRVVALLGSYWRGSIASISRFAGYKLHFGSINDNLGLQSLYAPMTSWSQSSLGGD